MRIGEMLIAEGKLDQDALEEALDWQVLYGGRLGTNLLELKMVEEKDLALSLGKQLGCEVTWGEIQLDASLINLIPKHICDRQEIVPWKMERRRLKILCTEIRLDEMDALGYKLGRPCVPVVAPEYRVFNLLRAHYGAMRQMRALDFGVVPEEGRDDRRKKKLKEQGKAEVEAAPELIDESAFNDIYNQVLAGRGIARDAAAAEQGWSPHESAEPAQTWQPPARPEPPTMSPQAPLTMPPGGMRPLTTPPGGTRPLTTPAQGARPAPTLPPSPHFPPAPQAAPAQPVPAASQAAPAQPVPAAPQAAPAQPVPAASQAAAARRALAPPPFIPPALSRRPPPDSGPRARASPGLAEAAVRPPAPAPPDEPEVLEELPADAILEELPADAIEGEPAAEERELPPPQPVAWEMHEPEKPRIDESPIDFKEALRLLEGVSDRDSIAHIVLRASRAKAARALLLQVQGGVALGWDGLGEGLSGGAARAVAVPLSAPSAFQLVVKTCSHFMGPLQKTPVNIRFLGAIGKRVPLSSLLVPILHKGRVSHLLYLDNGHKQQAPTDVGEMLILSQRIAQTVDALVARKRKAARG